MRCASAAAAKAERLHSNLFLSRPPSLDTPRTALVLLNTPPRPAAALRRLWSLSAFRVCADAAANRLRDSIQLVMQDEAGVSGGPAALRRRLLELQRVAREHELMVPDVVTGDFDSIREDVLEFYRGRGCRIAHNSSQDSTDFEKALDIVAEAQNAAGHQPWTVVAFGAFGNRFDHELASTNALFKFRHEFGRLILMGERMTACLLQPGRHRILPNPLLEGPTCGLLPIGGPVESISTSGLRWDLQSDRLAFGSLVSSSNEILFNQPGNAAEVMVETSDDVVWTTVLQPHGWSSAEGLSNDLD
ncbi:hypothetical protein AB1Y20_002434 [Prymnesium parvum]|uniref:Thiamin pyrophosphokinase thiamin-binding domain-containing protein n=1 Tax=Prymnesium parvum TaxID=97485 RepID=A0AB34J8Z2_PRYPA